MIEPTENERKSQLLSTYLDKNVMGTKEEINIWRKAILLNERLRNIDNYPLFTIEVGSYGEGLHLKGSDRDRMIVDQMVLAIYPDQYIPKHMAGKTILLIREGDCRPGYVNLELHQLGHIHYKSISNSLVSVGSSIFLSSDIYREQHVRSVGAVVGVAYESNGPSSSTRLMGELDSVYCFPCNSWPREAREWTTRTRLYGWPCQTLIDKIVQNGCHLVPVGDKCSEDTLLQWKISFAPAERSLVHSFSHVQLKVYGLLKYFLKQIKGTLKDTIGDDDILCSYFLKTILFHVLEKTEKWFWQDQNLFYCFWFCFNILIASVKAGFCPNYFIPDNNLFQRKIHGQHQQILLDVLNRYSQMKWMCLSVGSYFQPVSKILSDSSMKAHLERPSPLWETVLRRDITTSKVLPISMWIERLTLKSVKAAIQLLPTSGTDFDDNYTYFYAMKGLQIFATERIFPYHLAAQQNKIKYERLRKCKHWMTHQAVMGTDMLYLATFHYLTGAFGKSLEVSKQVMTLASYYVAGYIDSHPQLREMYRHESLHQRELYERLKKIYTQFLIFHHNRMYLPHLSLELFREHRCIQIPPLPYALFLTFVCCHELGHTRKRDAALQSLIKVQYDIEQGGKKFWIVHTLIGICYQTLGDYHGACRAYWASAQWSEDPLSKWNTAIERIAVVYLCMYVIQRSDKE